MTSLRACLAGFIASLRACFGWFYGQFKGLFGWFFNSSLRGCLRLFCGHFMSHLALRVKGVIV